LRPFVETNTPPTVCVCEKLGFVVVVVAVGAVGWTSEQAVRATAPATAKSVRSCMSWNLQWVFE
jgi:hypothetical protein